MVLTLQPETALFQLENPCHIPIFNYFPSGRLCSYRSLGFYLHFCSVILSSTARSCPVFVNFLLLRHGADCLPGQRLVGPLTSLRSAATHLLGVTAVMPLPCALQYSTKHTCA